MERQCEWGRGRERERERGGDTESKAGSTALSVLSPIWGSIS